MNLKLHKPLCIFDLETTGINISKDRIVEICILKVFPDDKKIVVEGLNIIKKHVRPRKEGEVGQRLEMPRRVDASNALLVCPKCSKPSRIGYKQGSGKRRRGRYWSPIANPNGDTSTGTIHAGLPFFEDHGPGRAVGEQP